MQWKDSTLCVVAVPKELRRMNGGAGHTAECLLSEKSKNYGKGIGTYSCSKRSIGKFKILVCSEVDVRENDKSLVEIKSKTSDGSVFDLGVKTAVQLTCNTSETLLCARLDKNGTVMKSV